MGVNYPPYVGEGSPGASRVSKLLDFGKQDTGSL